MGRYAPGIASAWLRKARYSASRVWAAALSPAFSGSRVACQAALAFCRQACTSAATSGGVFFSAWTCAVSVSYWACNGWRSAWLRFWRSLRLAETENSPSLEKSHSTS